MQTYEILLFAVSPMQNRIHKNNDVCAELQHVQPKAETKSENNNTQREWLVVYNPVS